MQKIKGSSICMQLDITKSFDKLQWPFLLKALQFSKFLEVWIKELIITSRGSVLINRSPSGFFPSSCELRQGDHLSPYLFILAEEILNLNIQELQSKGIISPVSQVPNTPCLLLYADGLMLFLRASLRSIHCIKHLLARYELAAG